VVKRSERLGGLGDAYRRRAETSSTTRPRPGELVDHGAARAAATLPAAARRAMQRSIVASA
jgi:hypothetical protein